MTASAQLGIKETSEVLVAAFAIAKVLGLALKDGFQPGQDVSAIIAGLMVSPDVREKIAAAFEGIKDVPAEVGDTKLGEGLAIAKLAIGETEKLLTALKAA